jgi:hypothetical protein
MKGVMPLLLVTVFLNIAGFSLILPLLPFYVVWRHPFRGDLPVCRLFAGQCFRRDFLGPAFGSHRPAAGADHDHRRRGTELCRVCVCAHAGCGHRHPHRQWIFQWHIRCGDRRDRRHHPAAAAGKERRLLWCGIQPGFCHGSGHRWPARHSRPGLAGIPAADPRGRSVDCLRIDLGHGHVEGDAPVRRRCARTAELWRSAALRQWSAAVVATLSDRLLRCRGLCIHRSRVRLVDRAPLWVDHPGSRTGLPGGGWSGAVRAVAADRAAGRPLWRGAAHCRWSAAAGAGHCPAAGVAHARS